MKQQQMGERQGEEEKGKRMRMSHGRVLRRRKRRRRGRKVQMWTKVQRMPQTLLIMMMIWR